MKFRVVPHAEEECIRRGIPRELLEEILAHPDQLVPASGGRKAYQSKRDVGGGRIMLIRAIVDEGTTPPTVATVYRRSKNAKYWSKP